MQDKLDTLIGQREHQRLEFKASSDKLPDTIWETISAFANSKGGYLYLGITEDNGVAKSITGVLNADKILQQFNNSLNNPQVISTSIGISARIIEYQGAVIKVIEINVQEADLFHKPVYIKANPARSYIRSSSDDGDRKCAPDLLEQFNRDKFIAKQQYLDIALHDYHAPWNNWLKQDSINKYFDAIYREKHSKVASLPDLANDSCETILESYNIIILNPKTQKLNLSVTGFLTFGIHNRLLIRFSSFKLDYQEFAYEEQLRPNLRIDTDFEGDNPANIFDFFEAVKNRFRDITIAEKSSFIVDKHGQRQEDLKFRILREALVNCLIHCDYQLNSKILIRKYPDKIIFENPGTILVDKQSLFTSNIKPVHRNPSLVKLFRRAGYSDEGGRGLLDIKNYMDLLAAGEPKLLQLYNLGFISTSLILPLNLQNSISIELTDEDRASLFPNSINTLEQSDDDLVRSLESSFDYSLSDIVQKVQEQERSPARDVKSAILYLCDKEFRTAEFIATILQRNSRSIKNYIYELVEQGDLETKLPGIKARNQSYRTIKI